MDLQISWCYDISICDKTALWSWLGYSGLQWNSESRQNSLKIHWKSTQNPFFPPILSTLHSCRCRLAASRERVGAHHKGQSDTSQPQAWAAWDEGSVKSAHSWVTAVTRAAFFQVTKTCAAPTISIFASKLRRVSHVFFFFCKCSFLIIWSALPWYRWRVCS